MNEKHNPFEDFKPHMQRMKGQLRTTIAVGHELVADLDAIIKHFKQARALIIAESSENGLQAMDLAVLSDIKERLEALYKDRDALKKDIRKYVKLQVRLKQVSNGRVPLTIAVLQSMEGFNLTEIRLNQMLGDRQAELKCANAQRQIRGMKKYI